jgi:hypothetical protein
MSRLFTTALAVLVAIALQSSCTPEEVEAFKSLDHDTQVLVIKSMAKPTGCVEAMERVWPASLHGWAMGIMKRESGLRPDAKNPSSSASSCFQLLSIHAGRYNKCGYSWERDRFNAYANACAAYDLYKEAGTRPWQL